MNARSTKVVSCAIYTRVSTDQGLEQDFNSLDAQYDASQAYIRSQAHAGWSLLRAKYDDGGFSGGNTDRPALQRLLEDVRAGTVDVIVVYKVDRLTRSLADFAKLVELFDRHKVSFVSVTQQFNTTTSMGRLTLNVLLSFAQFEREVTSERIRDKIAASKRKGLWVGGMAPLGYDTKDRRITVNEPEAETVRTIFRSYLQLGSLNLLMADLRKRNIVTKLRALKTGETVGGIPFTRGPLAHLLRNRFYIGEVPFKGEILKGEQPAIVNRDLFEAVQAKLSERVNGHKAARMKSEALLIGRIFDDRGNRMSPSHARKGGIKYRYYLSSALLQGMADGAGSVHRVPAADIEALVVRSIREHLKPAAPVDDYTLIDTHVARVEVQPEQLVIHLAPAKTPDRQRANGDNILNVRWRKTPSTRRREILLPAGLPPPPLRCAIPSFCLLIGRVSMPAGLFYRDTVHARGGTAMEMRVFGRTGMQLSALGFGCGAVGGLMVRGDPVDQERTIARATAAGVNYFDTAVQYGNGESEKNLGRVLQKLKPANAVVGTKVRLPSGDFARIADAVAKSLESSLTRLHLDHVDIFHLHNAITETGGGEALSVRQVLGDVVPAFERLRQQGKTRFLGLTAVGDTAALHQVIGARVFDSAQVVYNMLNPSAAAGLPANYPAQDYGRLFDHTGAAGVGVVGIRVLAGGALSGSVERHPIAGEPPEPIGSAMSYDADVARARRLMPLVEEGFAASLTEAATRFALSHPAIGTILVGMATPQQFEDAFAAVQKGPLPPTALDRLSELRQAFAGEPR